MCTDPGHRTRHGHVRARLSAVLGHVCHGSPDLVCLYIYILYGCTGVCGCVCLCVCVCVCVCVYAPLRLAAQVAPAPAGRQSASEWGGGVEACGGQVQQVDFARSLALPFQRPIYKHEYIYKYIYMYIYIYIYIYIYTYILHTYEGSHGQRGIYLLSLATH
jgi:hypothetical protein